MKEPAMSSRLVSTSCLALFVLGAASCKDPAPAGDRDDRRAGAPAVSPAAAASAATQLDLVRELDAVDIAPDPDAAGEALGQRWRGKRLTWTVTRQPALCASPEACHVLPFPVPAPEATSRH